MVFPRISKKSTFVILLSIMNLFCHHSLRGQEGEVDLLSVSVKEVELEKVLRILSEKSGIVFISDPAVRGRKISLDLKDVEPLEALSILTELFDLGFQQLGVSGKYVVADKSEIQVRTQLGSYVCEFADARSLAQTIGQVVTPEVGSAFVDERTNSVIYIDTPSKLIAIERLIRELDRPTRQVYIKAAIAEVSVTEESERGVHWFTQLNNVLNSPGEGAAATDFTALDRIPTQLTFPNVSAGLGIGIINYDIDIAIAFLAKTADLDLLSSPYLITLDNHTAIIEVGDQIPYPKLNEFGVTSYEFKDATIRLKIRPHINNDSTITVYLEPQANFQQGFTPDGIPIIAKRSAQTQVVVGDGQTVVLGGLMRESEVTAQTMVPVIGSIPIIGELFKSTQRTWQKTELVVLLTPKILDIDTWKQIRELQGQLPPEDILRKLK
ncbi:MAG: secretin N-terminal domain-containing protein [Candidatus Neomarinimicrobiota bacterium]